jgi:hypothetical protein
MLKNSPTGWWNSIASADLDGNGLSDFVIGNLGLNYKYKASEARPFKVYSSDMDKNGTWDIVLGTFYGSTMYPVRGRTCSSQQMPGIKDKFPTFEKFARADINDVYGDQLKASHTLQVTEFASLILYQDKPGQFSLVRMPMQCQTAPVNGILLKDINGDGTTDIAMAGNLYQSEIETGRADAGTGCILLNKGKRELQPLTVVQSGWYCDGDVKSLAFVRRGVGKGDILVAGRNRGGAGVWALDALPQ